jgi:hypothetical protein
VLDPADRELVLFFAREQRIAPNLGHVGRHWIAQGQRAGALGDRAREFGAEQRDLDLVELLVGRRADVLEQLRVRLLVACELGVGQLGLDR